MANYIPILIAVIAAGWALFYRPIDHRLTVLGHHRAKDSFHAIHGSSTLRAIPNTIHCEDLHHHRESNLLFTACQADTKARVAWFPPLEHFSDHKIAGLGSLNVINPDTYTSTKLELDGFTGPFVTHGIDIYSTPAEPNTVYIFAVNHLPNPDHYEPATPAKRSPEKARSQIEIFRHVVGSNRAEHLRTIRHPLIRTPNDIFILSSTSFYVTNDHYYRDGHMRFVEELGTLSTTPWSDTVHVVFDGHAKPADPTSGVTVTKVLQELHNNNGLGHAHPSRPNEVLIVDASGGKLVRAKSSISPNGTALLEVRDHLQLASTIDNPSYFVDEWAQPGDNATGPVLAGLGRAIDLAKAAVTDDVPIPVMVWHVRAAHADAKGFGGTGEVLEKRLIFQDDGTRVRSSSAAVLVGIDPKTTGGKKQAKLFVTGFLSDAVATTTIDL